MSAPITIQMTLTGPFVGETKILNEIQFIDGVCLFTGSETEVEGITKYFTRSYQVEVKEVKPETEVEVEVEDDEAVRVDDSDVISDEELEDEPEEPNARQRDIIAAVNGIEKAEWVDLQAAIPHPRVKDVQVLIEDPTISKNEIIEVIEKWLS